MEAVKTEELQKNLESTEEKKPKREPLLVRAWDKLFYEGITADGVMFWCKGFTRTGLDVYAVDVVIHRPKSKGAEWQYEGGIMVKGPVLIHPIVK